MSIRFAAFVLVVLAIISFSVSSHAETSKQVRKRQTTVTEVETVGDEEEPPPPGAPPVQTPVSESEITTRFGSKATTGTAGCKTEELSKSVVRDLKSDCAAWMKDQKVQLKGRYLTGSCEEECNDCGMSLQRCNVTGTVRYSK